MKYLLLATLLTSCAYSKYPMYRDTKPVVKTNIEKLESCIVRFIERDGVKAKVAHDICSSIYRRE